MSDGPDPIISFRGDSDAHIVKGLVAITLEIFSNRKASDILSLNAIEVLKELELDEHLSLQRSNGLKAMIARIKDYAQNALN
jgi:cysteine desulfuration protein SufE